MTAARVLAVTAALLCAAAVAGVVLAGGGDDDAAAPSPATVPARDGMVRGGELLAPALRREVRARYAARLARGRDVTLALVPAAQRAAVAGLRGVEGAAVAVDVRTGEVAVWAGGGRGGHPGRSRVPPGSTLKAVIAAAALDAGVITPSTRLDGDGTVVPGELNVGGERYGPIDVATALVRSSNALRASGTRVLGGVRDGSGTNQFLGPDGRFRDPDRLRVSTAAQLARNAAALVDGSVPRLRLSREAPSGRTRAFGAGAVRTVRRAMRRVVTEGTAASLRDTRVPVAAKTGTMPRGDGRTQDSMIALVPAGRPRYAVAVTVAAPAGTTGDQAAGPIARRVLDALAG